MGLFNVGSVFGIDINCDGKADVLDDLLFIDMNENEECKEGDDN